MKYLTLLIILPLLSACNPHDPDQFANYCVTPYVTGAGPSRIIAYGDSQTEGYRYCLNGHSFSWASQMSVDLNRTLLNKAIGGTLWQDDGLHINTGYALFMATQFQTTDIVGMLIGFNDVNTYGLDQSHLDLFKTQLKAALDYGSPLVTKIVIGRTIHTHVYVGPGSPDATIAYQQAIADVVAAGNYPNVFSAVVDDQFWTDDYYYYRDGIHINPAAQIMVANILEQL